MQFFDLFLLGGDDCRLKGWDLRTGVDCPIFTNKRLALTFCTFLFYAELTHNGQI